MSKAPFEVQNGSRATVTFGGKEYPAAFNVVDGALLLAIRGAERLEPGSAIFVGVDAFKVGGEHTCALADARLYAITAAD